MARRERSQPPRGHCPYRSREPESAGRPIVFEGLCRMRLREGLIVHYAEAFDRGVAFSQLGHATERTAKLLARYATWLRAQPGDRARAGPEPLEPRDHHAVPTGPRGGAPRGGRRRDRQARAGRGSRAAEPGTCEDRMARTHRTLPLDDASGERPSGGRIDRRFEGWPGREPSGPVASAQGCSAAGRSAIDRTVRNDFVGRLANRLMRTAQASRERALAGVRAVGRIGVHGMSALAPRASAD